MAKTRKGPQSESNYVHDKDVKKWSKICIWGWLGPEKEPQLNQDKILQIINDEKNVKKNLWDI